MNRHHSFHRLRLPVWGTLLLAVLLAGFYTLLCLWAQPNSLRAIVAVFRGQPLLIVLNALPVGLTILCLTFLFRNVFAAAAVGGGVWAVLSVANRIKIEVRDEPVFPRDLGLLKEAGAAAGGYDIHWPVGVIAVVVMVTLIMLALAALTKCGPFPIAALRRWWYRALGALLSGGALAVLILTVYASGDLYNSFSVSNAYHVPVVFNELGFPYCFCRHFTTYTVDKPAGYSRAEAESWETGDVPGQGKDVHVIMVMNEAFSDLTDDPAFTYPADNDPLASLHAAQASQFCVSGRIVVPGFAGGTANTEFDVLTGMQTNALSATTTSALRAVNRNVDSLFRVFDSDGYQTLFMHPGDDWFYNRENVYRWFGAEETLFADEMADLQYKGRWVTDAYMADLIEEKFDDALERGDGPVFSFTTTIQNHMSYTADKYGPDYDYPAVETTAALSDQSDTLLRVYIEGLRDADAMLGSLMDRFSRRQEPVVLVFFGDHLPYLGDNQLAYRELGSQVAVAEEERTDLYCPYEVPYVIWANDAAAAALDWDSAVSSLDLPADGRISACYLGQAVLELTGRGEESPWFACLGQVRRELPVIQKQTAALMDGTVVKQAELSAEQQSLISRLRCWSYYKLKQKTVP
ncbi:LTA synthase family protein [Dysosmobacter sp.]|uniref:LTA synthase family protein n=1 Tax=Dysosmobacter sp. TaxID=2591382 RepID=UPI002A89F02E|nr:LTA synthase family protein [Dysosmobacter sp.]MDY3281709.1 LTA synthase family protein [Dysosmobacter sp.]